MNNETFKIRQYGRTELALAYSPHLTPKGAWEKLKLWMRVNPRLQPLLNEKSGGQGSRSFTPKQVKAIVDELGEP